MPKCRTEDAVVRLIRDRGEAGRSKYRKSMDRRDITPSGWVRHFQEELADGLQYAERMHGLALLLESAIPIMRKHAEAGQPQAIAWMKKLQRQCDFPCQFPAGHKEESHARLDA